MTNKEISKALKLSAALGELHGENPFKLKSLNNASFQIDRLSEPLLGKTLSEIQSIQGIGKGIADKIIELIEEGTTAELQNYLEKTPVGVVEMLSVKGIGPKKVAMLWHELGIESTGELLYACNENRLVSLKGFGAKTQESIKKSLEYKLANQGKLLLSEAKEIGHEIVDFINKEEPHWKVSITGQLRRKLEIIDELEILVDVDEIALADVLGRNPVFKVVSSEEGFLEALFEENHKVLFICSNESDFDRQLLISTGPAEHLIELDFDSEEPAENEHEFYSERSLPFIIPELRDLPIRESAEIDSDKLVVFSDIKGTIHNHSTWSDGANTLEEMALGAKNLGLEYLIICDHSKSAFYAGGLSIDQVNEQWKEIDSLNKKLEPFHIFKGIESDILVDGSLDYPDEILSGFDLIVASVHSVLKMDEEKATQRLIRAIENKYTGMLGHPTGRLLLSREGYPVNHKKIIDACADNHVIIELNANPFRLDIDWRWIPYCMEKGVKISINPDAHRIEGYHDMHYGIEVARKGGLTREFLFNSFSLHEMTNFLKQ